jgi:dienelactone hydrolase
MGGVRSTQGFGIYRASENHTLLEPTRYRRDGRARLILTMHGITGNAFAALAPAYGGHIPRILAHRGYIVLAIDGGDRSLNGAGWANNNVMQAMQQGIDYARSLGCKPGKVGLVGLSMGALSCLRFIADGETEVGAAWLGIPAVDAGSIWDLNQYRTSMDTAWGGNFTANGRTATNLVARADELGDTPILMHVANNDPIALPDRANALAGAAANARVVDLGAVGHDYLAMNQYASKVVKFFESNL